MNYKLQINCKVWQTTPNSLIDFELDENIFLSTKVDKRGTLYKKGLKLKFVYNHSLQNTNIKNVNELINNDSNLFFKKCNSNRNKIVSSNVNSHINSNVNNNNNQENSNPPPDGLFLCHVIPNKDIYEVSLSNTIYKSDPIDANDIDEIPWLITKYTFDNNTYKKGYILREGDLLKLGKYILKIRQIHLMPEIQIQNSNTNKQINEKKEYDEDISRNILFHNNIKEDYIKNSTLLKKEFLLLNSKKDSKKEESSNNEQINHENKDKPICRICLCDDFDVNNPLINPCKCSGTMKYLHLNCLRELVNSKIQKVSGPNVTTITFKALECEICKSLLPENVIIKNKTYNIIDIGRPKNNYMIIEGIIKENPDCKSIFLINFNEVKSVKLGRATDADVRLSDISVSRAHAVINVVNNQCYLIDTKSKFGTLVNAGNQLLVLPYKPLCIQKGSFFLKFLSSKKFCAMLTCYRPKSLPFLDYNNFFKDYSCLKCQIKDVPNFLRTDTQVVSEYDEDNEGKEDKKKGEIYEVKNINDNKNYNGNNVEGDHTYINDVTNLNNEAEGINENNRNGNLGLVQILGSNNNIRSVVTGLDNRGNLGDAMDITQENQV